MCSQRFSQKANIWECVSYSVISINEFCIQQGQGPNILQGLTQFRGWVQMLHYSYVLNHFWLVVHAGIKNLILAVVWLGYQQHRGLPVGATIWDVITPKYEAWLSVYWAVMDNPMKRLYHVATIIRFAPSSPTEILPSCEIKRKD